MLKRLHLKNFTVFADADFEFVQGLNVLVGTNGTGKSHVLKVGYVAAQTAAGAIQSRRTKPDEVISQGLTFSDIVKLSVRLSSVFLAGTQNKLVRNIANEQDAQIEASLGSAGNAELAFSIGFSEDPSNKMGEASFIVRSEDDNTIATAPVFIQAKEILSLMPDIVGISAQNSDVFDSTYTDLATQLTIRTPKELPAFAKPILDAWAALMRGTIVSEDGRFYFQPAIGSRFRVGLAAEGFRKLGTLAHLLANGSLTKNATLFWDEPETNLNSALLRELAKALAELASEGFQIILATHSMSLLKEFHILSRRKNAQQFELKYFGLNALPGHATTIVTTDNFEYLPDVVALEVELEQADDLEEIFVREDRERHANNR